MLRDAIRDYAARADRLGEGERRRLLAAVDAFAARRPVRGAAEVRRELAEIRASRRASSLHRATRLGE